MSDLKNNSEIINKELQAMKSFNKIIDEFDGTLDDTRNIESVIDFDIFDMSKSDDKISEGLINPAMQPSNSSSITNISESNILELDMLKNVDNELSDNDDVINTRDNNLKYPQKQMSARNENSDQNLKHEESLCTQCRVNFTEEDLFLGAETDLLNNEVFISKSKNISNVMNRAIEVLDYQDDVGETDKITHRHLSSSLLFTPSDEHPSFTRHSMTESMPKKNSSLQFSSRLEISPKDLLKRVADIENYKIVSAEFEKKRLSCKQSLPKFDRRSKIYLSCDLYYRSQQTQFSHLNKSKSEGNIVFIKCKKVSNTCERTDLVNLSYDLSMRTVKNVEQKSNSSQVEQHEELIDIPTLRQVSFTGDKLEQIQSVGNRCVFNEKKPSDIETLNGGTSFSFRREFIASARSENAENVAPERKIDSMSIQSTVEEGCHMKLEKKSVNSVLPETSMKDDNKETHGTKDVTFVSSIGGSTRHVNSGEKKQSNNKKDINLIDMSNSFLEFSIESELNKIEKLTEIRKEETNNPIHEITNVTSSITNSGNFSEIHTEKYIEPVNLAVVKINNSCIKDSEKKDTGAENLESIYPPSYIDAQFLSDKKFEKADTEKEDEKMALKNIDVHNFISDPIILKVASKDNDPILSNKNVQSPADDFSSQFLSESQLEKIEKEALIKDKACKTAPGIAKKTELESITNQKDIIHKSLNINSNTEDNVTHDIPSVPNWVTNPTPEPNYNKMRHVNRSQRDCTRKMLHEILRLSTIITKIGSIINETPQKDNFQLESKNNPPIPDSRSVLCVEMNPQNGPQDLETFPSKNFNVNCINNVGKKSKTSDVFYVPESIGESNDNTSSVFTNILMNTQPVNFGTLYANAATIDAKVHRNLPSNIKEKDKLYTPQTIGVSKFDPPVIFNDFNNVECEKSKVFSIYNTEFTGHVEDFHYHSTSNIFGSLKNNSNDFEARKPAARSTCYDDNEKEYKIQKKRFKSTDILKNDTKLENFNIPVSCEDNNRAIQSIGNVKNKTKPVSNIFYSPDEPSSSLASNNTLIKNNYTQSLGTKNFAKVSLHNNFITQSSSCNVGPNESRLLNLERNFTSLQTKHTDRSGIFYNG